MRTAPDKPKPATCSGCGIALMRYRAHRNNYSYCSELCRHWIQWGAWSSRLPKTHPAIARPPRIPRIPVVRTPAPKHEVACEWCGRLGMSHQSRARFCSAPCTKKAGRARRRARQHRAPGTYSWAQLVRLWHAFDEACAYCGSATPMGDIQAEHVHPLSRGGRNDLGNLLPSCGPCNSDKRDLLLPEWNADRQRRGLTPVTTTWSDWDTRYAHLVQALSLAA